MRVVYEISGKYDKPERCDGLVNSSVDPGVTYQHSRIYEFTFEGDNAALESFVRHCLFDEIGQVLTRDPGPPPGLSLLVEVGMKPGALDLEKEAILSVHRARPESGFALSTLRLRQRYCFFGPVTESIERRLVRDLVNPAIQTHTLERSA